MIIVQIDPKTVLIRNSPSKQDIIHQAGRLQNEGQIEPCVVEPLAQAFGKPVFQVDTEHDDHFHLDEAIIQATCWLGWPSILVTY